MRWLDVDLVDRTTAARERAARTTLESLYGRQDLDAAKLEQAVTLVEDVAQAEVDRETNLNTRATAVASVAGVIVAVSGAVGKTAFGAERWTDVTKILAVALFGVAMYCLALSIVFTVHHVLRPTRGPRTKNVLGDTLVDIWNQGDAASLLDADVARLQLLRFDRAIRTLPEWHLRNRIKARWLRRAWVFLGFGIVSLAVASLFVVGETLGIPAPSEDGPASQIEWRHIVAFLGGLAAVTLLALGFDVVGAQRPVDESEPLGNVDEIVARLAESPLRPTPQQVLG